MPLRPPAGFISAFYDPLKVADAPTAASATGGDTQAVVSFTAPFNTGGASITQYYVVSDPNQITGNAAASPVTVTGLTNGTGYTFRVWALNSYGPSPYSAATGSVSPAATRGLFGGGSISGVSSNVIDYISISTTGDATDFGDLTVAGKYLAACSSSTRGVWGGGVGRGNVIDYVTIASTGNATDFGDLTVATGYIAACSSNTRGVWAGGADRTNVMDYVTIATVGNATDFGDLTRATFGMGGCASPTRGLFGGGYDSSHTNVIDYITIATTGNATDFGDLTVRRFYLGSCSNSTRGLWAAGYDNSVLYNVIDYVTIATTGNAIDFGDTTMSGYGVSGCSSSTRGVFSGFNTSYASDTPSNVINYVTIESIGNASDFGDLTIARGGMGSCSSGHGGLS